MSADDSSVVSVDESSNGEQSNQPTCSRTVKKPKNGQKVQQKVTGKRRKTRRYNPKWRDTYGVIEVHGHAICALCSWTVPVESLKPNKLSMHLQNNHKKIFNLAPESRKSEFKKAIQQREQQAALMKRAYSTDEKRAITSFKLAYLVARKHRPHSEGDVLSECFSILSSNLFDDLPEAQRRLTQMPMSRDTIARRITMIDADVFGQLLRDLKKTMWWSVAIDESTDFTDVPQLALFVRFSTPVEFREEILSLLPLRTQTRGIDVYKAFTDFCESQDVPMTTLCHVATDGGPAMVGVHNGFVTLLKAKYPTITSMHCIIHREALAAKELSPDLNEVMETCIKAVNFVKANALQRRLFRELCDDQGDEYNELVLHTSVRWLSKGNMLERLFKLRDSMFTFLEQSRSELAESFRDTGFLVKLAFLADVFMLLNQLNLRMQGRGKLIFVLLENVKAFVETIRTLETQLSVDDLRTFDHLSQCRIGLADKDWLRIRAALLQYLRSLRREFERRFPDMNDDHSLYRRPFDANASKYGGKLALQLIDLQSSEDEKIRFRDSELAAFWLGLDGNRFPDLRSSAIRALTCHGSTYVCESSFSVMNSIKTRVRSCLSNDRLLHNLRVAMTEYEPNYSRLISEQQIQVAH